MIIHPVEDNKKGNLFKIAFFNENARGTE